ncbi:MAG: VOC family protein [Holophagaceae bacterium]
MTTASTCLWFDDRAEEAVQFYLTLFPHSRILHTTFYLEGAPKPPGTVLAIRFTLNGAEYLALNGNPSFPFTPATSMVAACDTQEEVDTLWEKLSEGGEAGQCGWLRDRFGVSWQIQPRPLLALLTTEDRAASQRVFDAIRPMRKLDLAALLQAHAGPA